MKKYLKLISVLCMTVFIMAFACVIPSSAASYPESSHNYSNSMDYTWYYTHSDTTVDSLNITFSAATCTEAVYDYIYIYTLSGSLVGKYSGSQLSGATVNVEGYGFRIRMTSDSTYTYYGFSITNVQGKYNVSIEDCTVELVEAEYIYKGIAQYPAVNVMYGDEVLEQNTDYTVTCTDNVNAGTATATISGIGTYYGSVQLNYTINPLDLANADIVVDKQDYTGDAIEPAVRVMVGDVEIPSTEYSVSYNNNIELGKATAVVTALGSNTIGENKTEFEIRMPLPESEHNYGAYTNEIWTYEYEGADYVDVVFSDETYVGYGSSISVYTISGDLVGEYTYSSLAGATVRVPGAGFKVKLYSGYYGGYYGFKVVDAIPGQQTSISAFTASLSTTTYTYNGSAKTPSVTVKNGTVVLTKDVDYTVEYSKNTNAGTATVTITGIGEYKGTITKKFTINKYNLKNATVTVADMTWTGSALKPSVTVKMGSVTISSSNYSVSYSNNKNVGTASVKIKATGSNYTGSKTVNFKILKPPYPESEHDYAYNTDTTWTYKHYKSCDYLKIKFNSQTEVENKYDKIYIYTTAGKLVGEYTGTELAGKTIKVDGNGFKIKLTSDYAVNKYGFKIDSVTSYNYVSLSKCKVTLSSTSYTYNGNAKKPTVTVKYGSTKLKKGTDYTVTYSNNTSAGTAKVTVKGIGKYEGTVKKTFTIKKFNLKNASITKISNKEYTGKAIKPSVTVKSGSTKLKSSNYTISYSNNKKVGTATITIKAKGSNTTGSKKITFKIVPSINYEKKNIFKGKSFTLKLDGVSVSKVKFSTSKKSVCTVSSKGVVKGIKAGTATITAKYNGVSYKCKVTVLATASSSTETSYYKNHSDVPDFGALLKIEPTDTTTSTTDGDTFLYSLSDVQKVDPDKESGENYQNLLKASGFEKDGTVKIDGKSYYKYVSEKKIVYFGIASKNDEIKIIIKLK